MLIQELLNLQEAIHRGPGARIAVYNNVDTKNESDAKKVFAQVVDKGNVSDCPEYDDLIKKYKKIGDLYNGINVTVELANKIQAEAKKAGYKKGDGLVLPTSSLADACAKLDALLQNTLTKA